MKTAPHKIDLTGLMAPKPRALMSRPRADANVSRVLADLNTAFTDFKAGYDAKLSAVETSLCEKIGASSLNRGGGFATPVDPEYSGAYNSYIRGGRNEEEVKAANGQGLRQRINASMSEGALSSGGYLAPTEWDRTISQALIIISPMRRLATVQATGAQAFSKLWNTAAWGSGWVGETASRAETSSTTLTSIPFATGEIYAMPSASQRLLDDSLIDLEMWISDQVSVEFARQEGIAFISGNGTNKPYGLLSYVTGGAGDGIHPGGNLTVLTSGNATTIPTTDVLVDFAYSLPAPYRQNATWLMNSATAATIAKFKDGQGNYIWRESFIVGQPATLLGRPVEIDEGMPSIGAGALAVAFGDFAAGYLINDRLGTRILRDPFTAKPFVLYYTTKRVGGGVMDPIAIRLLKISV